MNKGSFNGINFSFLDIAPIGVLIIDKDDFIVYENRSLMNIICTPPNDDSLVLGLDLKKIHPVIDAGLIHLIDQIHAGETIQGYTFKYTTLAGKIAELELNSTSLTDDHNKYIGAVIMISDDRKIKSAQKEVTETEERFKQLFEKNPDAIFLAKVGGEDQGQIVDANKAAELQTGYSKEELLTKNIIHDLSIDANKNETSNIENILTSGKGYNFIERKRKKNGEIYISEVSIAPISYSGIPYALSISRDITAQRLKDDENRKLIRSIERSPASIIISDRHGYIEYVNPQFTKDFDYQKAEILGEKAQDFLFNNEDLKRQIISDLIKSNEFKGEFKLKTNKGKLVWTLISITRLYDEDGKVCNMIAILENISLRKKHEEELIKAKEKAEESDRLKSFFITMMSHELRTPLNAIIGFSSIIDENLTTNEICEYADIINTSGQNLLNIVEEVFDIALIESGEVKLNYSDFRLSELMQEIKMRLEIEKDLHLNEHVTIVFNPNPETLNYSIHSDLQKLKQILMNLLKNSLKFTKKGYIECGFYHRLPDEIHFYIKDTGIGIPSEKLEIIFDIFRQVDESNTRKFGGIGLGLAICQKLTKLLNGRIWVESEPGKGSTFYVAIKAQLKDQNNMQVINEKTGKLELYLTGKTIIVAEDEEYNYRFLEKLITMRGGTVKWATNGFDVLEILKKTSIDLILMDIKMPEMNGYEATRMVKNEYPTIPIIAQTAFALFGDSEKAIEAGCDDYISKPIMVNDLLMKLRYHLGII